ncbi:MAG: hypothetical protein ACLVJH_19320 [Faecalibacterium prausnitzii]
MLGAATAALVFAAPQICAEAFRQGARALRRRRCVVVRFCGARRLSRSGAGEVLGVLPGRWYAVSARAAAARAVCCSSALWAALLLLPLPHAEAVRSRELTSQDFGLLPACICSGHPFVILTVVSSCWAAVRRGCVCLPHRYSAGWLTAALFCRVRGIPEPLPAPPAAAQIRNPPPALDTILAQAAVTYLKLSGFGAAFLACWRQAAGCCRLPRLHPFPPCCWKRAPLQHHARPHRSVGKRAVLRRTQRAGRLQRRQQARTSLPAGGALFKPLLWGRALHLPLSLALFYLGLPERAVESFNTVQTG